MLVGDMPPVFSQCPATTSSFYIKAAWHTKHDSHSIDGGNRRQRAGGVTSTLAADAHLSCCMPRNDGRRAWW